MSLTWNDITWRPPPTYICMFSLCTVLQRFSTAASGELPQNYAVRQSQPFQNSGIAYRLLNSSVNHCIEALSHLLRYAIYFAWLSHDQNEQNSERELIVSLSSTSFSVMFSSCLSCNRTGEVFSYAAIQTMFMLAEVHLALHYSFKIFPQF